MSIRKGQSAAGIVGLCGAVLAMLLSVKFVTAAEIGDGTLVFSSQGVGVEGQPVGALSPSQQIDFDAGSGNTEALAVDLGKDAVSAKVFVTELIGGEGGGEHGFWQAFDAVGQLVSSGLIDGTTLPDYNNFSGTLTISGIGEFRYLVFTALDFTNPVPGGDSSDYYVHRIAVDYDGNGIFESTFTGTDPAGWPDLYGFNFGTPFVDEGGSFVGASPAPIVVNDQECSTGQGTNNQSCKIEFTQELTTTIAGEDVEGIIKVAGISTVVDFREGCGFSVPDPKRKLPGATKPIEEIGGALDLGFTLEIVGAPDVFGDNEPDDDVTGPIVPPHLCGIPPTDGADYGEFVLVNLDSDIVISRSVIENVVNNDPHLDTGYECTTGAEVLKLNAADRDERRSRLPVFGWLPKTSNPEIPVLDAYRELIPVLEDVTTGCGSTRSGASRLSFLVYDLHHAPAADYRSIIRDEILQLQVTVNETPVCVDSSQAENLKSRVRLTLDGYDKNRLSYAKKELGGLLSLVQSKRLDREFAKCAFDLDSWTVTPVNPADQNLVPRNFRGDLIVQIRHIQYMMDRMLGVTSP